MEDIFAIMQFCFIIMKTLKETWKKKKKRTKKEQTEIAAGFFIEMKNNRFENKYE